MSATNVLDLVTSWAKAEEANDAAALDRLLAGDFVGVGPLGFVLDRDQWLARFGLTLVAARPDGRWVLAGVHIGPLQQPPAGPPPSSS